MGEVRWGGVGNRWPFFLWREERRGEERRGEERNSINAVRTVLYMKLARSMFKREKEAIYERRDEQFKYLHHQ